jgi:hypothetical protein
MDLKGKAEAKTKEPEVKYYHTTRVLMVAQQIEQEYKNGVYTSWFVRASNGVLSAMPLPHGWYPFNVKRIHKAF